MSKPKIIPLWLEPTIAAPSHYELHENGEVLKIWPAGTTPDVWLWVRDDGTAAWMETERHANGTEIYWVIAESAGPQ